MASYDEIMSRVGAKKITDPKPGTKEFGERSQRRRVRIKDKPKPRINQRKAARKTTAEDRAQQNRANAPDAPGGFMERLRNL